ncbi:bacteriocin immunity protein [Pseudomonas chengduensis]|nr:bacteriocin immunity protein [Pseudomonas chengduensis]MDH1866193.1 bacteriocin immunity protein [Pseudomonas chengduensis]
MKKQLSDYSEREFIALMEDIFRENEAETDDRLDAVLDQFREITGHPDGTDLIYYCESDAECTPERITQKVKSWRAANGLPGFKST